MKRYSLEDRDRIVAAFRRSGLSQAAFAEQIGLSVWALRDWIYRPKPREQSQRLVPVRMATPSSSTVEVTLPHGLSARVPADVASDFVAALVRALE
jgi:lambda repressor-like predicted transcriptional regulator